MRIKKLIRIFVGMRIGGIYQNIVECVSGKLLEYLLKMRFGKPIRIVVGED